MTGAEILEFVKTFGFPGAVAVFVLWRLDKRLSELVHEMRRSNEAHLGIKEHVTQVGRDIVREVDHNMREAMWPR